MAQVGYAHQYGFKCSQHFPAHLRIADVTPARQQWKREWVLQGSGSWRQLCSPACQAAPTPCPRVKPSPQLVFVCTAVSWLLHVLTKLEVPVRRLKRQGQFRDLSCAKINGMLCLNLTQSRCLNNRVPKLMSFLKLCTCISLQVLHPSTLSKILLQCQFVIPRLHSPFVLLRQCSTFLSMQNSPELSPSSLSLAHV